MILLFSKKECGPCILVKKYFKALEDVRIEAVKELLLDDGETQNIATAKQYGIHATPTLIVLNETGEVMESYEGGVPITQNIIRILENYV